MRNPTKKQRARAGLRLALQELEQAEFDASIAARVLAQSKKKLEHARTVARLAAADARQAGVL